MYEICEARTMRICPEIGDETLCEVLWVSYLKFIPKSSMKLKDILDQMGVCIRFLCHSATGCDAFISQIYY